MSATGWARVRVQTEAAVRERERISARAELEGERGRLAALTRRADEEGRRWGVELASPERFRDVGDGADAATLREAAERLRRINADYEDELDARRRVVRAQRSGDRLSALRDERFRARTAGPDTPDSGVPDPVDDSIDAALATAAAAGLDLDPLVPLADAAREASGEHRVLAVTHLVSRVETLTRERDRSDREAVALAAQEDELARLRGVLTGALSGAVGPASLLADLDAAAASVRSGYPLDAALLRRLSGAVDAELEAAGRAVDLAELGIQVFESLAATGYEVVTDMATAGVADGFIVTRPEWDGRYVLQVNTTAGSVTTEALRVAPSSASQLEAETDRRVEEAVCSDLGTVFDDLETRSIAVDERRMPPAGTLGIKVLPPTKTAARVTKRAVQRSQTREREAGR